MRPGRQAKQSQNKILTFKAYPNHAGEMIVGPRKVLFMDEITNGIDSSTAIQLVACLQQFAHTTDATILVSLLQPPPEAFGLFDDIILMAEGKIVYHGPRNQVLEYFEYCGFKCPRRKAIADFLQEVSTKFFVSDVSFTVSFGTVQNAFHLGSIFNFD